MIRASSINRERHSCSPRRTASTSTRRPSPDTSQKQRRQPADETPHPTSCDTPAQAWPPRQAPPPQTSWQGWATQPPPWRWSTNTALTEPTPGSPTRCLSWEPSGQPDHLKQPAMPSPWVIEVRPRDKLAASRVSDQYKVNSPSSAFCAADRDSADRSRILCMSP